MPRSGPLRFIGDPDLNQYGFTPYEYRVLGQIAMRCGKGRECFEKIDNMANHCCMGRKKVMQAIRDLENFGVISCYREHAKTIRIIINDKSHWR